MEILSLLPKILGIARSTASGGLAGGLTLLLIMVAQSYGYPLSETQAGLLVGGVMWLVVHLTPDSVKNQVAALASKLNVTPQTVASQLLALIPVVEGSYPEGPNGKAAAAIVSISNINKA